ncbi:MAG: (p)ppGpp synthase/HD superfamily hydrolase, partial [Phenylobacterium sp.]
AKITVLNIRSKNDNKHQVCILDLDIEIFNEADLPRIMGKLSGMDGVIEVKRVVN